MFINSNHHFEKLVILLRVSCVVARPASGIGNDIGNIGETKSP